MLVCLLDRCGRFLYLSEDSHRRLNFLLDKLKRFMVNKLPDYSYRAMIENALLATIPQDENDNATGIYKEEPKHPILKYAEYLILHDLGNITDPDQENEGENCNRIIHILKKFPLKKMTVEAEEVFRKSMDLRACNFFFCFL